MTWNYRIVQYRNGSGYGLHEVYYDEEGREVNMTRDPISFVADKDEGPEGVTKSLRMALADAMHRPVFIEPDEWKREAE